MDEQQPLNRVWRWLGLAVFCMAFGLVGGAGGLWLMNDALRGPQGEPGVSIEGPPGPPGEPGAQPELPDTLAEVILKWDPLQARLADIDARLDELERNTSRPPQRLPCLATQVVTDVSIEFSDLDVRKSGLVCLPYP